MNTRRDLRSELIADLEQIEDNVWLFQQGRNSAYQTVALQLRNLLLEGRRGLLLRVIPDATLFPVAEPADNERPPPEPGLMRATLFGHAAYYPPWRGAPARIALPLDRERKPMTVDQWVEQWVVAPGVKIRELIASTANEEVAHTEDARGRLLSRLAGAGVRFVSADDLEAGRLDAGEVAREMYQMAIVAIGESVAGRVRELLAL